MSKELREPMRWFAEKMEQQLKVNDHKGGWDDCEILYLFGKLNESVDKLGRTSSKDHATLIEEAADVANYAMMLADKARRKVGEGSE